MRFYFKNFKLHVKSQLQYKTSFILGAISQFAIFFTYYFTVIGLFQKFSNVKGYTVYEVLLCLGIIYFGFSINELFFRGIDRFEDLIIDGSLDRFLVRPQSIIYQALCSKVDLIKIARALQAVVIIIIAVLNLNIEWDIIKVLILLLMIIGSITVFFGLMLITASYCFITIQGLEVKSIITDGGKNVAQYPISIFKKGFVFVFTFIIPYAAVNYYPLVYLLGKTNNILYALSPLLTFVYLIPCFLCFRIGMKHYESTGS